MCNLQISNLADHFTGTRCLSSSNQFTMMLIFLGASAAAVLPAVATSFIIRKRFPSRLMSQGFPSSGEYKGYFPRKRTYGFPALNAGCVSTATAITASPLR